MSGMEAGGVGALFDDASFDRDALAPAPAETVAGVSAPDGLTADRAPDCVVAAAEASVRAPGSVGNAAGVGSLTGSASGGIVARI